MILAFVVSNSMRAKDLEPTRIEAAKQGMTDATSPPGLNLASAIDGITLIAQNETDLLEQYELERMAADLLHRSLDKARSNGGRLYAEA